MSKRQKRRRPYTHITRIGRHRVADVTGKVWMDEHGTVEIPYRQLVGYERRAVRVVLQQLRTVEGAVLRFARKALGLRQEQLAALLDRTGAEISRYENDARPIPRAIQLAVAELLCLVETEGESVLDDLLDENRPHPGLLEVRGKRRAV